MFNFATKEKNKINEPVNDNKIGLHIAGGNIFAFIPFRSKDEYQTFFNYDFFGLGKYYGASGCEDLVYHQLINQIISKFKKMINNLLDQENNRINALEIEYSRIGSPLAVMKSQLDTFKQKSLEQVELLKEQLELCNSKNGDVLNALNDFEVGFSSGGTDRLYQLFVPTLAKHN